ncbi:hypothetical protein CVD28_24010 [Bacillus sp. M6-12]|uniref:hypothetical protein n=1 Tax=Bacillus sp. M6-12 TaxID=2054166 RepID=UPI000C75A452|nr:hypothetical protein [Bacillus sp. M6-12]PLS15390.1 hypothetical protein CVD28_24010 [Bacillus sp. M6-12]
MSVLNNERGNATFYLLWLLGIVALIFVITINIVKVYIVKEQANLSVEQAALAATAVLLEKTDYAVKEFESSSPESAAQMMLDRKSISQLIEEKKAEYMNSGKDEATAYIKAANEILPSRLVLYPTLKSAFRTSLGASEAEISSIVAPEVQEIISQNNANADDTTIEFSTEKWRIEIKSTATFESIADNKYISYFLRDIPQKGYGPVLEYIESVYAGSLIL